jgi:hypothetical protein
VEILRVEADDGTSSLSGGSDVGPAVADLDEDLLDVLLLQNSSRLAEFFATHSAETIDIKKGRRNPDSKINLAKRLPHHDKLYFSHVVDF